jgi:hypothetical protein
MGSGTYYGSIGFFRQRLSNLKIPEILAESKALDEQAKQIKLEAMRSVWYMRGGLSFAEAMNLSWDERELVLEIVKDNMDITKSSGLPFF